MLQINPKKFKQIQNKTIPSPLRPKFRNSNETNIYFLSKRKFEGKKRDLLVKRIKFFLSILIIGVGGYFLSN
tara:strand:- start:109 stop:324 length:216 start_codon:yes stop_codon:yes gene_type:complete